DLRVGDFRFDNTHPLRGGFPGRAFMSFGEGMAEIPVDDDPDAIRAAVWYATARKPKRAGEQLTRVKTNAAVGVAAEDTAPDFSAEPREAYTEPVARIAVDPRVWEDKIRRYTAPFARYGDIYEADAVFIAEVDSRWYVNSEGTEIQTSQPIYRLYVSAFSKADDGMELPRYESFWAFTPEGLPNDRAVLAAVQKMIDDLPTLRRLDGSDLAGFYRYDDEGVKARRVAVVEHGVLKTFLMARSPIEGFASSNGHGRAQLGLAPVARQSNLVVETAEPHSEAELKRMLIDEIKRENKPYGLLFDDIEGGFTITMRFIPNAFNVMPVMVYRVYPDGREELVRDVDFIGTPLTTFSKIVAADDHMAVFNGMCGAESG